MRAGEGKTGGFGRFFVGGNFVTCGMGATAAIFFGTAFLFYGLGVVIGRAIESKKHK